MHLRIIFSAAALTVASLGAATAVAAPASALPAAAATSYSCGYDGYNGSANDLPLYNHCGRGDVVLEVNHYFWQTTYECVGPGVHYLNQGDSSFAIIGAEADGHTCGLPGTNLEGP